MVQVLSRTGSLYLCACGPARSYGLRACRLLLVGLHFCRPRCHPHVVTWVRVAQKDTGEGPVGGLRSVCWVTSTFSTVARCTKRRGVPRGGVGGRRLVGTGLKYPFFYVFLGGLKNVIGWSKVSPTLLDGTGSWTSVLARSLREKGHRRQGRCW